MKTRVQLVTYNNEDTIEVCLNSILRQKDAEVEVVVVDNDSSDRTVEIIHRFRDDILTVTNEVNVGFGAGHNIASNAGAADFGYNWILNPDAWLEDPYAIKKMVDWMEQHPGFGLCGTRVIEEAKPDLQERRYKYPRERQGRKSFASLPGEIAWVIGASMFFRSSVYRTIKGFDEDFFLYGEETDICLRTREAGFEIGFNEAVRVGHIGGESEKRETRYDLYLKRALSRALFFEKHYGDRYRALVCYEMKQSRRKLRSLKIKGLFSAVDQSETGRYKAVVEVMRQCLRNGKNRDGSEAL